MAARGAGLAMLKWVTSFPDNPARGLPVVTGALLLSDAGTGELAAIIDCASITSLRTGAAAAVSAQALAPDAARSVGLIGCGVNGAWAARCLAAAGYGPASAQTPAQAAEALADRARVARRDSRGGGGAGRRRHGHARRRAGALDADLRRGQHLAVLGADAHGKAEVALGRGRSLRASSATSGSRRRRAASSPARWRRDRPPRGRDRARRRSCSGERAGPPTRTRSPSSTRPGSRSRTWRSPRLCSTRGGRGEVEAPLVEF